jgi:cytochrome c oxidase assembly protein Cox11
LTHLEERNQKIIDAVIEKANTVCSGAVALIGINGSFMTGAGSWAVPLYRMICRLDMTSIALPGRV